MRINNLFRLAVLISVLVLSGWAGSAAALAPDADPSTDPADLPIDQLLNQLSSQPVDRCAQKCSITDATGTDAIAKRQACDTCRLQQDQDNLRQVRATEDGLDVQKNYDACQSAYSPMELPTLPSIGDYVPVHETGELLSVTQSSNNHLYNIDQFAGQSYDINILLCMYLHAIKRVSYAMEDLTFIKEPDMRRQAATKVEEYKKALLGPDGLMQTGYSPSGERFTNESGISTEGGDSLYPKNLRTYIGQAGQEGADIYLNDLKNSGNSFKDEVSEALANELAAPDRSLVSTISRTQYEQMQTGGQGMKNDEWWSVFLNLSNMDYPNSPSTAYTQAKSRLMSEMDSRREVALNEYMSGNGYLPVRKCALPTVDNKFCLLWENVTPGTAINQITGGALNARLDEYINPEIGQVGEGNEPSINEAESFRPNPSTGGGKIGGLSDFGTGGSRNGNGGTIPRPPVPNPKIKPVLNIRAANSRLRGEMTVSWSASNVSSCKTSNNWLGSTAAGLAKNLKSRATSLPLSGDLIFKTPIAFDFSWTKNGGGALKVGMSTTTISASTSIKMVWQVPVPGTESDLIELRLKDGDTTYAINAGGSKNPFKHLTAAEVVNAFQALEAASKNKKVPLYSRYQFGYYRNNGAPYITIQIRPDLFVWDFECEGLNGKIESASSND
jgi:hypothetical protein